MKAAVITFTIRGRTPLILNPKVCATGPCGTICNGVSEDQQVRLGADVVRPYYEAKQKGGWKYIDERVRLLAHAEDSK